MERIEADSIYEKASIYEKFQDLTQVSTFQFHPGASQKLVMEKHLYVRKKVHFNVHISH